MVSKKSVWILVVGLVMASMGCSKMQEQANGGVQPSEDTYLREDWGVVKSLEFVRAGKSSVHFKVATDKYDFSELDITDFPDDKIVVGDRLFKQTKMNSKVVNVSMCKNDMCMAHSSCYWWMPCFNKYEPLLGKNDGSAVDKK